MPSIYAKKAPYGVGCLLGTALAVLSPAATSSLAWAATVPSFEELKHLSIEDLGKIEITSVSKRAEPLSKAAASVFVITSDDIRRSGAVNLPEALRLAPNLMVQHADSGQYATFRVYGQGYDYGPNRSAARG